MNILREIIIYINRDTKHNKTKQNKTQQNKTKQQNNNKTQQMAMKPGDIDLGNVSFSAPKTLDNGGKMLFLNYNGGTNPLYMQTPELELTFDLSYYADNETSGKYKCETSLKNLDSNPKIKELHTFLTNLDDHLISEAQKNSQGWFKKPKLSIDTIKELYTPMVKVHVDPDSGEPTGKFADRLAFKIVKKNNKFE